MYIFVLILVTVGTVVGADLNRRDRDELMQLLGQVNSNAQHEKSGLISETQNNWLEAQGGNNTNPPHFLFILFDDLGFNDVSWNNPDVITPNLQALADEGVILDYHYAHAVYTPSRGAFLTGKYSHNIGMQHGILGYQTPHCLDLTQKTLPQQLKEFGYENYMLGKWYLGFCKLECTPLFRGFDKFIGYYQGWNDYYNHTSGFPWTPGYDFRDGLNVDFADNGTFTTDLLESRAVDMILNHDPSKPMFMYLSHAAPHTPVGEAPKRFLDMYPNETDVNKKYVKALVTSADYSLRRVIEALKLKGMYENTVIMFASDNGGKAQFSDNYPQRGAKSSIFEGGTRVPALFHSPLATVKGIRAQGLFHITDWYATMMSLVGGDLSGLDGVDQTDMLFHGGDSARNEIVYNIDEYFPQQKGAYAIHVGDYKLIKGFPGEYDGWEQHEGLGYTAERDYMGMSLSLEDIGKDPPSNAYIWIMENIFQLYNLVDDPEERNNLAALMPGKVAELDARINVLKAGAKKINVDSLNDVPEGSPDNFNGIWESGWC